MPTAPINKTAPPRSKEVHHIDARWCEKCQAWKNMAVLKRIGDRASIVDYVPTCATCKGILLLCKPRPEF